MATDLMFADEITKMLETKLNGMPQDLRILEAGCGRSWPLKLSRLYHLTGIDMDQAAALVSRSKKTLERKLNNGTMPQPDIEGGGGKKHEWEYAKLRPWLEATYCRMLPDRPPHTRR